jgi:hypothetical protein
MSQMRGLEDIMKRKQQSPRWGFSERQSNAAKQIETMSFDCSGDQLQLDYLMEMGFAWEEAAKLLNMREHLYKNIEMRQRMADDSRLLFARWLFENGEICEE